MNTTFGIAKDGIDAFFNHQKIKQDKLFFITAERREKKNHRTAIGLSKEQFLDAQMCDKQTHLIQTLTEMQLHFEQLNSDLVAQAKDNGTMPLFE
jgi:hypothetical protein